MTFKGPFQPKLFYERRQNDLEVSKIQEENEVEVSEVFCDDRKKYSMSWEIRRGFFPFPYESILNKDDFFVVVVVVVAA